MIGHSIQEFYNIRDAQPNDQGLITLNLLPLIDLVVFPNMVTPLLVRRESAVAAISDAQAHGETVLGITQRDPTMATPSRRSFGGNRDGVGPVDEYCLTVIRAY
jgi:ATP-dependent Lon protease